MVKTVSFLVLAVCIFVVASADNFQFWTRAARQVLPRTATLYQHSEQKGVKAEIKAVDNECHEIPFAFHERASAINTYGGCVQLYSQNGCQGAKKYFIENCFWGDCCGDHTNFASCNFDDQAMSYAFCDETAQTIYDQQQQQQRRLP
uniref:Uncharacterized protein n=1 Tax=Panagrolaimus davidi TaxID=227884 RepID=A0A914PW64_9BILA